MRRRQDVHQAQGAAHDRPFQPHHRRREGQGALCAVPRRAPRAPEPQPFGHFQIVKLDDGVSLDYAETSGDFPSQHYALLVSNDVFDGLIAKIRDRGIEHWADPRGQHPGEINTNDGGAGSTSRTRRVTSWRPSPSLTAAGDGSRGDSARSRSPFMRCSTAMRLLQSLPALSLLSSLALCGCERSSSSSPSGGHEAATASAAIADRPAPPGEGAAPAPSPAASILAAPAASAALSPSASPPPTHAPPRSSRPARPRPQRRRRRERCALRLRERRRRSPHRRTDRRARARRRGDVPQGRRGLVQHLDAIVRALHRRATRQRAGGARGQGRVSLQRQIPYKFKLGAPSSGVTFPQPIVRAEGMRVAPERSVMTVPFVPSASGTRA